MSRCAKAGLVCLLLLALVILANWWLPGTAATITLVRSTAPIDVAHDRPVAAPAVPGAVLPHWAPTDPDAPPAIAPGSCAVRRPGPLPAIPNAPAAAGPAAAVPPALACLIVRPAFGAGTLAAWLLTVAALVAMTAAIGIALNGRPAGAIIDNRNRISLSKVQMFGWTVLILSGAATIAATMLAQLYEAPGTIVIGNELLALMGIALASTAAAPAVLSLKGAIVDTRADADEARWTDLFQGDEDSNAHAPDISKIQQFCISLLVMAVYAFRLGNLLRYGDPDGTAIGLPALSGDLVWLVGISHAGYLTYKAVPHQPAAAALARPEATGGGAAIIAEDGAVG